MPLLANNHHCHGFYEKLKPTHLWEITETAELFIRTNSNTSLTSPPFLNYSSKTVGI